MGKALYQEGVWDRYHYVMAAYQDGKLMAMLDQNSADSAQLTLYGPGRKDRRKLPADDGGLCGLRRHGFAGGVHRPAVPSAINAAARAHRARAVFPAKNTKFLPESS